MRGSDLFGDIRTIAQLYGTAIIYEEVYSNVFAKYYDVLPKEEFECNIYLDEAFSCGKSVLELCCGNGRLTTLFAEKGFTIDGVDTSKDMLAILKHKRQELCKSAARRLNPIQADVFTYCPCRDKYDFIFLPATTLCILSERMDMVTQLFKNISIMLKPHGSFMFDLRFYDRGLRNSCSDLFISTASIDKKPVLMLMQENLQYDTGRAIGNFYLQMDEDDGCVKRYITTTNKKMVSIDDLTECIDTTGLYIKEKKTIENGKNVINFFTLKKYRGG